MRTTTIKAKPLPLRWACNKAFKRVENSSTARIVHLCQLATYVGFFGRCLCLTANVHLLCPDVSVRWKPSAKLNIVVDHFLVQAKQHPKDAQSKFWLCAGTLRRLRHWHGGQNPPREAGSNRLVRDWAAQRL